MLTLSLSGTAPVRPGQRRAIAVGEKGTEAAAATAMLLAGGVPKLSLQATRPFSYFLRDQPTGAILFMGRVMDPAA